VSVCPFVFRCVTPSVPCVLAEVIRNKSLEHLDIEALVNEIAPRSR
jgi:hypothetical protein